MPRGVTAPELRATWARLSISIGGDPLTLVERDHSATATAIYVAAYPLAEWIAYNWWLLDSDYRPARLLPDARHRGTQLPVSSWQPHHRWHLSVTACHGQTSSSSRSTKRPSKRLGDSANADRSAFSVLGTPFSVSVSSNQGSAASWRRCWSGCGKQGSGRRCWRKNGSRSVRSSSPKSTSAEHQRASVSIRSHSVMMSRSSSWRLPRN